MAEYLIKGESLVAIADEVRELSGKTEEMGVNAMVDTLRTENSNFNTNLSAQDSLITQIQTALANKAQVSPVLQSKSVTPSATQQIVTADSGYDGLNRVTVTGDANLVPENIMSGVSIFGVEGNASASGGGGGSFETFNIQIIDNGGGVVMSFVNGCVVQSNELTAMPFVAAAPSLSGMILQVSFMAFGSIGALSITINGQPCDTSVTETRMYFEDGSCGGVTYLSFDSIWYYPGDEIVITVN